MPESDGNVSDEYELVDNRAEWHGDDTSEDEDDGPFSCKVCSNLLRDNVECSSCHNLFCREHLRINEATDSSPCPCKTCAFAKVPQPLLSFLPNIPVQRMADAVPSRCDGCGKSFSWGDLAKHACDRQTVVCEYASWGCSWKGQRQHRPQHLASSTCPGQLARAEHEVAKTSGEIASVRAELATVCKRKEAIEIRAVAAETRCQELEVKVAAAEKSLREKDAVIAKQTLTMETAVKLKAKAGERADAAGGRIKKSGGSSHAARESSSTQTSRYHPAATTSTTSTSVDIQQQLLGAMFTPRVATSSKTQQGTAAGSPTASAPTASSIQQQQKQQTRSDATGKIVSTSDVARPQSVGTDAGCQAPVPATEACLKPYLERPHALLEKKIVVFWPRQGRWYVGRPTVYKQASKEHRVEYDDGDVRDHVLAHRAWGLIG